MANRNYKPSTWSYEKNFGKRYITENDEQQDIHESQIYYTDPDASYDGYDDLGQDGYHNLFGE